MRKKGILGILILTFWLLYSSNASAQCPALNASFSWEQFCDSLEVTNTTTVNTGEIQSLQWDFGDGSPIVTVNDPAQFGNTFFHTYNTEDTYYFELKVFSSTGCDTTIQDTFNFYFPNALFQVSGTCIGDTVFFNDNSQANVDTISYWHWDFGDETTSLLQNPYHIYDTNGTYTVELAVENSIGCADTMWKNKLFEGPQAGFYADSACFGSPTQFTDTSTYLTNPIVSWYWDFGDGNTSIIQHPQHTFTSEGIHNVMLAIENNKGCVDTVYNDIYIASLPNVGFEYIFGCLNDTTWFIDTTQNTSGEIITWEWNFGDGSPHVYVQDTGHVYTVSGVYLPKLIVTNSFGCIDSAFSSIYVENPVAGFEFDSICFNSPAVFTDTSSYQVSVLTSYFWDLGDGTTAFTEDYTHNYTDPGVYQVRHAVTNSLMCSDTVMHTILVDTLPVADFTYDKTCEGLPTCFTDLSVANADTIISWEWNFGDGSISLLKNPCHTFADTGTYIVNLIVTNSDGCVSEPKIDTLHVQKPPIVAFSFNTVCFGDTTFFLNETDSQGVEVDMWRWTFGEGMAGVADTSYLYNANHLYTTPGVYNATLLALSINGCSDSLTKIVVVDTLPEANFVLPDTVAVGKEFTITDLSLPHGSPIVNTFWDFGDGNVASNINPVTHTYDTVGNYVICLTIDDFNGCSDEYCDTILISPLPSANFVYASDTTLETFFYDISTPENTIIDWFWDFGDPATTSDTISHIPEPVYTYPEEGFYEACLTVYDKFGGEETVCKTVYAGNAVKASFEEYGYCLNDSTTFIDNSFSPISAGFEAWYWEFGDGNSLTLLEPQDTVKHKYPGPGNYTAKLAISATVNGFFMTDTLTKIITIHEYPIAQMDTSGFGVCLNTPIYFKDLTSNPNDPIVGWKWDFGTEQGDYAYSPDTSFIYPQRGDYEVILEVTTNAGCIDSAFATAHVNYAPNFGFEVINACVDSPTEFNPQYNSDTLTITDWYWNFDDYLSDSINNFSSLENPTHVYDRVNIYYVTMEMWAYDCKGTSEKAILVMPIPYSNFSVVPDYQGVQGKTKFVNESIYAKSFEWDFGNGNTSTVPEPVEVYEKDSTYTITLYAKNEYNCYDTSTFELEVFFKGLYFPTAFSPNNPNENISYFEPKGVNLRSYEVQVYDLRGNLIWESSALDENGSPSEKWDGYHEGVLMPQGMYLWKASGIFRDGSAWTGQTFDEELPKTSGVVTLIR